MIKNRKKFIVLTVLAVILVGLIGWTVWGNTALELNQYTLRSEKLPESFSGYRIAQVSDLHNTELGKGNDRLLEVLREAKPDIITITGDLIDSRNTNVETALEFAREAVKIAPCYYVTGNHEARVPAEYSKLKKGLVELGVAILENERITLEKNGQTVILMGVDDPSLQTDYLFGDAESAMKAQLQTLMREKNAYTVLLSHRPELFDVYAENGVDLILSGHAHGGQFRLPFIGGLAAPNQGLFPEYDGGLYTNNGTNMIVSRGVGNSIVPFRFNNRPEVVLVELIYCP